MKRVAFFFLLLLFSFCTRAQNTSYPKGVYKSFEELKQRIPSLKSAFSVIKRTEQEIKDRRGNDFEVVFEDYTISPRFIKKKIYAISTGDSLFINCFPHKLQRGYANVIEEGRYLVFKTAIPSKEKRDFVPGPLILFGALVGGIIVESRLHNHSLIRLPFVIDFSNGMIYYLERYRLFEFLKQKPELEKKYRNEKDMDNEDVILQYLKALNDSLK